MQQIGNHPDELKYQRLHVKNLSKILNNCALSLDLLIKFGFKYTLNKSQLTFIGATQYISHEDKIIELLYARKLRWIVVQAAIRACFRADIDTRETFDSDTPPYGVFIIPKYLNQNNRVFNSSCENRKLSNKTQTTLRVKEMYHLNSFEDIFEHHFLIKSPDTKQIKKMQVYVFNNQGQFFKYIDWDEMDIDKSIYDCLRKRESDHQFIIKDFLSTTHKDENKRKFFKKCVHFLYDCHKHHFNHAHFTSSDLQRCYYFQKYYYDLLSILHKYDYLLKEVSKFCVWHIDKNMRISIYPCTHAIDRYMNRIVKPMIERLKKSKKRCKYIKNSMLSNKENSVDCVWRCLLCNTKNYYNFGKFKDLNSSFCPSCQWNKSNKLYSMCPLYFVQSNQSITFGIDPRVKPFYIIFDLDGKQYDCKIASNMIKKYSYIQAMIEIKFHLKLSTIVVGFRNEQSVIILFEKCNPLTLYDLKHLLFEIKLFATHGENKAKMWTFADVVFKDPNDENILNKLSDDDIIDIFEPCYVHINRIDTDFKLRRPVEFSKTQFDQGYFHSCCNTDNINTNSINKDQVPIETSNTAEVFDFEYSAFDALTSHTLHEMSGFIGKKSGVKTRINALLHLVKEVINNGYEKDLLPVNDASIDMMNKIVHEYEKKTKTSILRSPKEAHGNYGIFNKFNMGLIQELSKVYQIFDDGIFRSTMFHKRHEMIGYPLSCPEMLALMLYCDGECNHDLSKSQRSHTAMKKWPYFHCMLNCAIKTLSKFEIHYEHIYTGICGVFFEMNNEVKLVRFHTNVSFSTDLNVALQFRGDSGMVIGMNMKRTYNHPLSLDCFDACDVSWISSVGEEKEILCRVGSKMRIYPNLVRKRGNTQWIACVEDELDHDKAFKSIFGSLADIPLVDIT